MNETLPCALSPSLRQRAERQVGWAAHARVLRSPSALLFVSALFTGCGIQDPFSAHGSMSDSPVEQGERVDALSGSEQRALCASLNEELTTRFDNRRLSTVECTRMYLDSGDSLLCNSLVSDCVSVSLAAESRTGAARPPEFEIEEMECLALRSCSASVSEFDACVAALFDQSDQIMSKVRCAVANDPEAVDVLKAELDARRPVPASCVDVLGTCPGFF